MLTFSSSRLASLYAGVRACPTCCHGLLPVSEPSARHLLVGEDDANVPELETRPLYSSAGLPYLL